MALRHLSWHTFFEWTFDFVFRLQMIPRKSIVCEMNAKTIVCVCVNVCCKNFPISKWSTSWRKKNDINTFTKPRFGPAKARRATQSVHLLPLRMPRLKKTTTTIIYRKKKKLLIFFSFIKLKCKPAINWTFRYTFACVYTIGRIERDRPKISFIQFLFIQFNMINDCEKKTKDEDETEKNKI